MFFSLIAKIILLLCISSLFLFMTIVYLLYSGFILIAIAKTSFVIAIKIFVKLFKVLICYKIFCIIYFAHFLLNYAQHFSNINTYFKLHFFNYYNVVPFINTKNILVLTYIIFLTVIYSNNAKFAFFYKRKRYIFLYDKVFLNYIINLLSIPIILKDYCNISLFSTFKPGFIWGKFSIFGHISFDIDKKNIVLFFTILSFQLGFFISFFKKIQFIIAFNI